MACFKPLNGYRTPSGGFTFKSNLALRLNKAGTPNMMQVPCGQCIGCRMSKTREWAARCVHEASLHEENCFLTLTYNPENIPQNASLRKIDFRKFIRKLRQRLRLAGTHPPIRYYMCGEYGDNDGRKELGRPHFHALIFGYNYPDQIYRHTKGKSRVYTSLQLDKDWRKGHATVGEVTYQSAGYVARYTMKKINGPLAEETDEDGLKHYERIDSFGEIIAVLPEYTNMSLQPGIGKKWFDKYRQDVFPDDFVIIEGKKIPTPTYYLNKLKTLDPIEFDLIKSCRLANQQKNKSENTPERLAVREKCAEARLTQLKRTLQ